MTYQTFFVLLIIGANLYSFLIFGLDKFLAIHQRWRISEAHLLLACFLFGGIGGWLGMRMFHHKTQTHKFIWLVPIAGLITVLCLLWLLDVVRN
ncbi:DUF1294 domain-containing protein [Vaginisenegalia massiliensis]|uniref:DUF1294 domain-containing protein n=1 Tax=Vaginisenegalia massiliensis TaxID=2058294 RepID=UPI000F532756|nr:DUF1294 domain-containing protein [Vaginisenegalia massiliensis]